MRFKLLGVPVDQMNRSVLRENLRNKLLGNSFCHVATLNPEFLVEGQKNVQFRAILNETSLNICDGIGIRILSRLLYGKKIDRIPGVELAEMICEETSKLGKSVFFLGGYGVASVAAEKMKNKFPGLKIAGTLDGDMESFDKIKDTNPDVVLVAFGAPNQEYWLAQYGAGISSLRIGIGIGGTFDFWAGKTRRAPDWMRKFGLEWLFRLFYEPQKRGGRIFRAVMVFPWMVLREKLRRKEGNSPPSRGSERG